MLPLLSWPSHPIARARRHRRRTFFLRGCCLLRSQVSTRADASWDTCSTAIYAANGGEIEQYGNTCRHCRHSGAAGRPGRAKEVRSDGSREGVCGGGLKAGAAGWVRVSLPRDIRESISWDLWGSLGHRRHSRVEHHHVAPCPNSRHLLCPNLPPRMPPCPHFRGHALSPFVFHGGRPGS